MKGWTLVMAMAILLGLIYVIVWGGGGITDDNTLLLVRLTARTSCLAFLLAFIAAPLNRLWRSPVSTWLIQNRRFLGLSMAVSHTYHAVAFVTLDVYLRGLAVPEAHPLSVFCYLLLLGMTLTSFPLTSKAVGSRGWKILHTAGMYLSWVIFTAGFEARLEKEWGNPSSSSFYVFAISLMAIALLIRILGRRKSRVEAGAN